MPSHLFDDHFAPITSEIGLIDAPPVIAANAFLEWQRPLQLARNVRLTAHEIEGTFSSKIEALLPLTSVEARRFLFLPTSSKWTAYFDNGWQGSDVFGVVSHLAALVGTRGVRAVNIPDTIRKTPDGERGRFGATMLEMYSADTTDCAFLNVRRSVGVVNDGGRWRFDASGTPLECEQLERYSARRIRERFTPLMLDECLRHLGVHNLTSEFFNVTAPGYLVSKEGVTAVGLREYSLQDVRDALW